MSEQNKISTLFEFTEQGYNEVAARLDSLLAKSKTLRAEAATLAQQQSGAAVQVQKLTSAYVTLERVMANGSTKEQRQELVALKDALSQATAAQVSATTALTEQTRAEQANAKAIQTNQQLLDNYRRVLDELGKGMDSARVTTEALTKAKKYLAQEMSKTEVGSEKYRELSKELAQVTQATNKVTQSQRQQLAALNTQSGSVEELRQKVAALKKEWASLSQDDPQFSEKTRELAALAGQLKAAEESVGDFRRNVGNYQSALQSVLPFQTRWITQMQGIATAAPTVSAGLSVATTAVKSFGKALVALMANPVVLTITVLVAAFASLAKAMKSGMDNSNRLRAVLAPLSRIFDGLVAVLQKVGAVVLGAVEGFMKLVGWLSKLAESLPVVGGLFKQINDEMEESVRLAQRQADLQQSQITHIREIAALQLRSSEAQAKAAEKDKYTATERLKMLREAAEMEKQIAQKRADDLWKAYTITRDLNARNNSSFDDRKKEAEALAAWYEAEATLNNTLRSMQRRIQSFLSEERAELEARKKAVIAAFAAENAAAIEAAKAQQSYREASKLNSVQSVEDLNNIVAAYDRADKKYKKAIEAREALSKDFGLLTKSEWDSISEEAAEVGRQIADVYDKTTLQIYGKLTEITQQYIAQREKYNAAELALFKAETAARTEEDNQQVKHLREKLNEQYGLLMTYSKDNLYLRQQDTDAMQEQDEQRAAALLATYTETLEQMEALRKQLDDTALQSDADLLRGELEVLETVKNARQKGLEELGISIDELNADAKQSSDEALLNITEALTRSAETIEQFAGRSRNVWAKSVSSFAALTAKAFDISQAVKKLDKDTRAGQKALRGLKEELTALAVAAGSTALDAVASSLNTKFEAEKEAIDDLYSYEEKRAQESYDAQNEALKRSLESREITSVEYKLRQMELDDEKAAKDRERERKKANDLYNIELKQFRTEQATTAAQTAMQGALAIIQCWAQLGPLLAPAYSAIVGAATAAQIALIWAQKAPSKPKYARGGYLAFDEVEGPSHANGGVPVVVGGKEIAEVEGGEGMLVVSRKAMRSQRIRQMLAAVERENRRISGPNREAQKFENGGFGYIRPDDPTYASLPNLLKENRPLNQIEANLPKESRPLNQIEAKVPNTWDFQKFWDNIAWSLVSRFDTPAYNNTIRAGWWGETYYDYINDAGEYQHKKVRVYADGDGTAGLLNSARQIVEHEARRDWNRYVKANRDNIQQSADEAGAIMDARLSGNSTAAELGVQTMGQYYDAQDDAGYQKKVVQSQIDAYEALGDARLSALKAEVRYDEKIAEFKERSATADAELSDAQKELAKSLLVEMRDAAEITEDEYNSLLDQLETGYGKTAAEIVAMRQEQYEAVKKIAEAQRDAEIEEANTVADYQREALDQMRSEWEAEYQDITAAVVAGTLAGEEAVEKLTDADLARYSEILEIDEKIRQLNDEYAQNDQLLTDGVIETYEERRALLEEQLRIKRELDEQEAAAEEARAEFEKEREQNMDDARKAYEKENADTLMQRIRELGGALREEAEGWSLDNQITSELNAKLAEINARYDAQVAAQTQIVDGLDAELDRLQLVHDRKIAIIDAEQIAFVNDYNARAAIIDKWVADQTGSLKSRLADIQMTLAQLDVLGAEIGIAQYEKLLDELGKALEPLEYQQYATGGAVDLGGGLYEVQGNSHAAGGVPVKVGNTTVAEVEGVEKLFAVNKRAAQDPAMIAALSAASAINERYSGVGFGPLPTEAFRLDYERLAELIGRQINARPVQTYVTTESIARALSASATHKNSRGLH